MRIGESLRRYSKVTERLREVERQLRSWTCSIYLCESKTRNRAKLSNTRVVGNDLPSRPVGTPKIKTKYTG